MARAFVCKNVENVFERSINEIDSAISRMDDINLKAQYIYIYSVFEGTLTESLRYYLNSFPEKIKKDLSLTKEDLLRHELTVESLIYLVDKNIRSISHKSLFDYLSEYKALLDISFNIDKEMLGKISSTRNIIVHDVIKIDDLLPYYLPMKHDKICLQELHDKGTYLERLLQDILRSISEKYSGYTLEKACKSIWREIFSTPILEFDEIWKIEEGSIRLKDLKNVDFNSLARSEKLLIAIFLHQYNNTINDSLFEFHELPAFVSMSRSTKRKIVNIMKLFTLYPYLFNGQKISY